MELYSQVQYEADGTTDTFSVPFPYLDKSDVHVTQNGVDAFDEWVNNHTIRVVPFPDPGTIIEIQRKTQRDSRLVDYQAGATLTEADLDRANKQTFYLAQEAFDLYNSVLYPSLVKFAEDGNVVDINHDDLTNQIVNEVLNSELYGDLQENVTDIPLNAENWMEASLRGTDRFYELLKHRKDIEGNYVRIVDEQNSRLTGDQALADDITSLQGQIDTASGEITAIKNLEISSDDVLLQRFNNIESDVSTNAGHITNVEELDIDSSSALAIKLSSLETSTDDNQTAITNEQTARANQDEALASDVTSLLTVGGTGNVAYWQTKVPPNPSDGDLWMDTGSNPKKLKQYDSESASWSEVNGTLVDNYSAIQTHASSIDGLEAQYTVKTDVNGNVAGFGLANEATDTSGGSFSEFTVNVDRFAVTNPDSGDYKVPFIVDSSGLVTIDGQLVVDGSIYAEAIAANEIGADKLSVQSLDAISADMGTLTSGLIQTDSGANQRVELEAGATYPLWFGSGSKTASNAQFYVDNSGNAVFKGDLEAAGGTFSGTLNGVDGNFAGTLEADTVKTDNLVSNAVTVSDGAYFTNSVSRTADRSWNTIHQISYNGTGFPTIIWLGLIGSAIAHTAASYDGGCSVTTYFRLTRNGVELFSIQAGSSYDGSSAGISQTSENASFPIYDSNPPAGTITYRLEMQGYYYGSECDVSDCEGIAEKASLTAIETKR